MKRPAVFVDRDGVINQLVPDPRSGHAESPLRVADVRLIEGAAQALVRLRASGYALVCVTNQPAAAKGMALVSELQQIQFQVQALLAAEGAGLDDWRMCLHHPRGLVPELSGPCGCRKPSPGMLLAAANALDVDLERSWMVGDTDADMQAGHAARCRTVLVLNPNSKHKRSGLAADFAVRDLASALGPILHRGT